MTADLRPGEFYGATVSQEVAGVVLSVVSHDRERRLPSHTHALAFLCLLIDGRYEEEAAGELVRYEPLTLVFHPAKLAHSDVVFADSRMFTVEFADAWGDALAQYAPTDHSLYTHIGAEPLWIMLRLYEGLRDRTLTQLTVQTLCYELIGSFDRMEPSRDEERRPPWLRSVRRILDERFASHVDVAALAHDAGVHPVHLSRAFRKEYKVNIGDYVHRRRIQLACRMLRDQQMPIAAIADELGYTDQSHFSRIFRNITGKTPARYRAST